MKLKPGTIFGPYEIESQMGDSKLGTMYKARINGADDWRDAIVFVALRVSKSGFTARFAREVQSLAELRHPNISWLYELSLNYVATALIDGVPIKGPLPAKEAVEHAGQILDALDAAHRIRVFHRSLKPGNILLTMRGVTVLNFSLANTVGTGPDDVTLAALTEEGQISGDLPYMAPEQLQGKDPDARSDIFSFGCVLYEMLSGRPAFSGSSAASVIVAILDGEPDSLNIPPPLESVVRTCLAKDPGKRFQNALDVKHSLFRAIETEP
jgi:serine/threonine protein kinase